jgi:hypothetical protein
MTGRIHILSVFLLLLLAACAPPSAPTNPERNIQAETLLYRDTFDDAADWVTYDRETLFMDAADGVFRVLSSMPGRYVWSVHRDTHTDVLLGIEAQRVSDYDRVLYGLMCRADANGRGYYFMISGNGYYSIRRGREASTEPLIKWQPHEAIYTDGRANDLRAVCLGDYLALYVNNQYVDSATDDFYTEGRAGLVVDMPANTPADTRADIHFDNFRAWSVMFSIAD